MAFADNFLDMLVDTVDVVFFTGFDDTGSPQFGSGDSFASRVNYETKNVLGPNNQIVVARGVVWMDCVVQIHANDQIVLPDGTSPTILSIAQGSDENGIAYTKLYFQ